MELIEKVLIPCGDANFDLRDIVSAAYWLLGSHLPALMKSGGKGPTKHSAGHKHSTPSSAEDADLSIPIYCLP